MLIDSFTRKYAFLSNFAKCPHPIVIGSKQSLTAEALFQANKTLNAELQDKILASSAATAKKLGGKVELRPEWDEIRLRVMEIVIAAKFPDSMAAPLWSLSQKLMMTGSAILVEGNDWGDIFWGAVRPPDAQNGPWMGQNNLGLLLMRRREHLMRELA
jgi:hypothetical protein